MALEEWLLCQHRHLLSFCGFLLVLVVVVGWLLFNFKKIDEVLRLLVHLKEKKKAYLAAEAMLALTWKMQLVRMTC